MQTQRDHSRDKHGLQIIGATVGCLALGPIGALGLWAVGRAADNWVNENRDKYDTIKWPTEPFAFVNAVRKHVGLPVLGYSQYKENESDHLEWAKDHQALLAS